MVGISTYLRPISKIILSSETIRKNTVDMHLDRARDIFGLKSLNDTFIVIKENIQPPDIQIQYIS